MCIYQTRNLIPSAAGIEQHLIHFLVLLLAIVLSAAACIAQTSQSSSQGGAASNNWRDTPVRSNSHPDTISSSDRMARDGFFSKYFPAPRNGLYGHIGGTSRVFLPETVQVPGSFWAIGTFISYDVHEVATDGIYTEIHFRLDRLIGPSSQHAPQAGQILDIDVLGGTAISSSGEVHHRVGWRATYDHPMVPQRRYLIQLLPNPQGNFYESDAYFDLTTGIVQAVLPADIIRSREGKSHLNGLHEEEAITYLLNSIVNK